MCGNAPVNRVAYVVDGFNLYHSLCDIQRDNDDQSAKWLDIRGLCETYLPIMRTASGTWSELEAMYYFSAPPTHRSEAKQQRHKLYMRCLRQTGVIVQLQRFKLTTEQCYDCGRKWVRGEEKETDVAMVARLFEICIRDLADTVVLMTGDTDFAPAIQTCQRLFPEEHLLFAFPYKRGHDQLSQLAPDSFRISARACISHQFPDPLVFDDGRRQRKPASW